MSVVRIRTRETLCDPDVAALILRGAHKCGFEVPAQVIGDLARDVAAEHRGIFIGFDNGQPRAVAVGQLPTDGLTIAATVHIAYSQGAPRQIVADVAKCLRRWFQANGHDHVLVLNLFHPDESYIRGLSYFGKGKRVGGVIRFDL